MNLIEEFNTYLKDRGTVLTPLQQLMAESMLGGHDPGSKKIYQFGAMRTGKSFLLATLEGFFKHRLNMGVDLGKLQGRG